MYLPPKFHVQEPATLHALMRARALAVLVCQRDGALEANHVPVILDRTGDGPGRLRFHLARPNPMNAALAGEPEILAIFHGEESYISPDWYRNPKLVPTWNFAAVHAWGRPRALSDEALAELLVDLSAAQEARLEKTPWTVDKLPEDAYRRMRTAIAGYEMSISRLEGKWKMSQNRGRDDRAGVVSALAEQPSESARATATVMRELMQAEDEA